MSLYPSKQKGLAGTLPAYPLCLLLCGAFFDDLIGQEFEASNIRVADDLLNGHFLAFVDLLKDVRCFAKDVGSERANKSSECNNYGTDPSGQHSLVYYHKIPLKFLTRNQLSSVFIFP